MATGEACPCGDRHFEKGGCKTDLAAGIGSRVRWLLDRQSEEYKGVYKQRTVTERINSQAKELGIERPYLRNQRSITNQDTLIYILINLRVLERIRRKEPLAPEEAGPLATVCALSA